MRTFRDPRPIEKVRSVPTGGTGQDTEAGARAVLGLVANKDVGTASNPIPLDNEGVISESYFTDVLSNQITISGPLTILPRSDNAYTITNFDYRTRYEVKPITGTVVVEGDRISYNPGSSIGDVGFTINGRVFAITSVGIGVNKPSITAPVSGSTNQDKSVNFTSSVFTVSGGVDIHLLSEWQVSTNKDFTNLVSSISSNLTKVSWTVTDLYPNTTYYARVRYYGSTNGYSQWSDPINFTTKEKYAITIDPPFVANIYNGAGKTTFIVSDIVASSKNIEFYDATWEVSAEPGFGSIIQAVTTKNKAVDIILASGVYYVRVRVRGKNLLDNELISSTWSMVVQVTIT